MKSREFIIKVKSGVGMLIIATIILGTNKATAQTSATAGTAASVLVPVSVVKNVDMSFGNAAVSVMYGGAIVLSPSGARTTSGSGVTLPAVAGSVAAATFTVSGAPGYTYTLTLPASAALSGPSSATMIVTGFTSMPSGAGMLGSSGTQVINIGATLNVGASQVPGSYTNAGAIPVTVNYN